MTWQPSETLSEAGGGLSRGKVTREVLDKAFGPILLEIIEDYKRKRPLSESVAAATDRGEEKREHGYSNGTAIDVLAGTDTVGGKLQVGWIDFFFS